MQDKIRPTPDSEAAFCQIGACISNLQFLPVKLLCHTGMCACMRKWLCACMPALCASLFYFERCKTSSLGQVLLLKFYLEGDEIAAFRMAGK